MSEMNNMMKSVQVGTVDFFGILLPGLLASITTLVGFFIPIFLFVWNVSGGSLPITSTPPDLWGFGLFLLLVFSYVLGYILRLSSPDELDKISARNVILRELDRLHEHYEGHPEENGDRQDYKVKAWFRLILHYPTLRKLIKRIAKHALLAEEKKFSAFVLHDAWPYHPDDPLDKYPYLNFYWYLEQRGHADIAHLVNWGSDDIDSRKKRSKTVINRMKMDVRNSCPPLSRLIESKEGHIRLMAGTWTAFRLASKLVTACLAFATVTAFTFPQLRWFSIFSFVNLSLLVLMHYSIRRIEKLFHYRRISELFHIVYAACVAQQMKANGKTPLPELLEEAG